MTHSNQLNLFLKLLTLTALVTCLAFFTSQDTRLRLAMAAPQTLTVQVKPQPQSPLQFSSTKALSSDPFSPNIQFTVTNKGHKGIQAYTIVRELITESGSRRTALFTHLASQKDVLQPGQSRSDSINEPYSQVYVKSIIISIDFVELEDGITWGNDAYNSAERLAGQRAGGGSALDHFRKVRAEKGSSFLLEAVTSEEGGISLPEGHSPEWQDGFKTGVSLVRHRLMRANQHDGLKGIEAELQKPFDAKEGRPN